MVVRHHDRAPALRRHLITQRFALGEHRRRQPPYRLPRGVNAKTVGASPDRHRCSKDQPRSSASSSNVAADTDHAQPEYLALVGENEFDRTLPHRPVLCGLGGVQQLLGLSRLELPPGGADHLRQALLGGMAQRVAFVGRQRRRLVVLGLRFVFGREEAHLRLLEGGLLLGRGVDLGDHRARGVLAARAFAQGVDQGLLLLGGRGARFGVDGRQVAQVVPDDRAAGLERRAGIQAVVGAVEGLRHMGAD